MPHRGNTKRLLTLGLTCLLSIWSTTALVGCAQSDKKKAQDYLRAGADQIQKIQKQAAGWQNQLISATGTTDPTTLKKTVAEIKVSGRQMSNSVAGANGEYVKISRLKGVGDYVKYAGLRLAQLDMIREMLNKTNEFLDKKAALINSGNLSSLATVEQQYSNEISSISDKIQKIDNEAIRLKKNKKL